MNSMYAGYLEWRRQRWSQRAAAEQIASQFGYRDAAEVADVYRKMVALEERDGSITSSSTEEVAV
jgi:hypothetical protein